LKQNTILTFSPNIHLLPSAIYIIITYKYRHRPLSTPVHLPQNFGQEITRNLKTISITIIDHFLQNDFFVKVPLLLTNRFPPQLKVSIHPKIIFIASPTLPHTGHCYFLAHALKPCNFQTLNCHHATRLFSFLREHSIHLCLRHFFLTAELQASERISANLTKMLSLALSLSLNVAITTAVRSYRVTRYNSYP
jgi:hypothetical protein